MMLVTASAYPLLVSVRPRSWTIVGSQPDTTYASSDCSPMNAVTCHARGERQTRGPPFEVTGAAARRARASQASPATVAGAASSASGNRQLAPAARSIGTTTPAETAAPAV